MELGENHALVTHLGAIYSWRKDANRICVRNAIHNWREDANRICWERPCFGVHVEDNAFGADWDEAMRLRWRLLIKWTHGIKAGLNLGFP